MMRCRRRHTSAKKGTATCDLTLASWNAQYERESEGTEKPKPTKPDQTRVGVREGHCRSGDGRRSMGSCMKPLPLKTPTPLCPLHHKSKAEVLACVGRRNEKANSCTCTGTCSAGLGNSLRCKSIHNVAPWGLFQCSLMNCRGQMSTQRSRLHNCI